MFITPTPPTMRPTLETAIMKSTRPPVSWSQSLESESGPKISKSSGLSTCTLRRMRSSLADLFLDQRLVLRVVVFHADPHVLVFGVQVVEGAEGKVDLVVGGVLAAAEGLLALVEHADDGVEAGLDVDFLADGVLRRRRAASQVSWPSTQTCARALVFRVGPEAALEEGRGR